MITEIFNSLNKRDKDLLVYAINNGITQVVKLTCGRFIGVNISEADKRFQIIESENNWYYGRYDPDRTMWSP